MDPISFSSQAQVGCEITTLHSSNLNSHFNNHYFKPRQGTLDASLLPTKICVRESQSTSEKVTSLPCWLQPRHVQAPTFLHDHFPNLSKALTAGPDRWSVTCLSLRPYGYGLSNFKISNCRKKKKGMLSQLFLTPQFPGAQSPRTWSVAS